MGPKQNRTLKACLFFGLVLLVGYILFFHKLGETSLWDPDEPRYAETAREMIELDDYLTPRFNYKYRFGKPPLFYWLITFAYQVFGYNEFAARFWSAAAGLLVVILVYYLGRTIYDRMTGFLSASVLATSVAYLIISRICNTDMTLTLFMTLALFFFYKGWTKINRPSRRWYFLFFYASASLATLTKGPVGLFLPMAIILFFLLWNRQPKLVLKMEPIFGPIVFLGLSAPWYVLMCLRHGGDYAGAFFFKDHIMRFLGGGHHPEPVYYFIPVLIISFLPWTFFLPQALVHLFRRGLKSADKERNLFVFLWFAVIFIFFSLSNTKLATYILPAYPALGLMVGRYWRDAILEPHQPRFRYLQFSLYALLLGAIAFLSLGPSIIRSKFPEGHLAAVYAAAIFLVGLALSLCLYLRKRHLLSFLAICATIGVLNFMAVERVLPIIDAHKSTKAFTQRVQKLVRPEEKLASYLVLKRSMIFYARRPIITIDVQDELVDFMRTKEKVFCMIEEKWYEQYKGTLGIKMFPLDRWRDIILVSNKKE